MLIRRKMLQHQEKEDWDYILLPADGSEEGYIASKVLYVEAGNIVTIECFSTVKKGVFADFRQAGGTLAQAEAGKVTKVSEQITQSAKIGIANTWNMGDGVTEQGFPFYGQYIKVRIE